MERSVLNELSLRGRGLSFVSLDPRQNLLLGDLCGLFNTAGNRPNHVGNPIAPGGHGRQHLLGRYAAILGETIVAVDGHANHEPGIFRISEVHASQCVFVRQIHVDVRVQRSLSSASQLILGAMAPGAIGAKHGVQGFFESCQRLRFVETVRSYETFHVGSAASIRKL
jgi:hypothetical protein